MQAAVEQILQGGDGTEQKVPEKVCFDLKGQFKALIVGEASAAGIFAWCKSSSASGRWDQSLRGNFLGKTAAAWHVSLSCSLMGCFWLVSV